MVKSSIDPQQSILGLVTLSPFTLAHDLERYHPSVLVLEDEERMGSRHLCGMEGSLTSHSTVQESGRITQSASLLPVAPPLRSSWYLVFRSGYARK
jgi:hypothetical protein